MSPRNPRSSPDDGTSLTLAPNVLREYAFIADGERGALIGPRGEFAWLCVPSWDSDAVSSTLIGGVGSYYVSPAGRFVWGGYYEPRSLIWRSRWVTETAIVECREALAFPGDLHRTVVLRRIHVVSGDALLNVSLAPAAEFGRKQMTELRCDENGCWVGRGGNLRMRWWGASDATPVEDRGTGHRLDMALALHEGDAHDLVLELSDTELPSETTDAASTWTRTESAWAEAMPRFGPLAADRDAELSYAVMRGLTGASGGMVAASTMSLPERADQGANYDYRYVWIRDQCYAGRAVTADGPHPLLDNAVDFVSARLLEDGPKLMPAYTPSGRTVPAQEELDLAGYPGGYDIRGNRVHDQFQLDVFGEALALFAAAAAHDRLSGDHQRAAMIAVNAIEENWRRADAGIWELDDKQWTHSRLTCAAGLRAAASHQFGGRESGKLSALADAIVASVSADSLHFSGRWQSAPDEPRVDAALLLPALRGALPADDPRSIATYRAVEQDLCRDYYVYRFRPTGRLGSTDSAFLLCGFVMAMACLQRNDAVEAFRYFERNRAACGPPGIFSEEYDVRQRQMRGNLPQAFVHALMFEASSVLGRYGETSREEGSQ